MARAKRPLTRAELILHPVRMRMVAALARRELTPRQLGEILSDVPQATLYHQIGLLTRGGILRVVAERPVRGTVEKVYALATTPTLGVEDLATATSEDHLRYFTAFVAQLLSEFERYLSTGPADLARDFVGYRQVPLYLSDDEMLRFIHALNGAVLPVLRNEATPERRRRLFSTVLMPDVEAAPEGNGAPPPPSPDGASDAHPGA